MDVVGYTDRLSYSPGQPITVHADVQTATSVSVDLVTLRLDDNLALVTSEVAWTAAGDYDCVPQQHCIGAFLAADAPQTNSETWGFGCWVQPTNPTADGTQGLMAVHARGGERYGIALREGHLVLWAQQPDGTRSVVSKTSEQITLGHWYFAVAERDAAQTQLTVTKVGATTNPARTTDVGAARLPTLAPSQRNVTIAASSCRDIAESGVGWRGVCEEAFDGKIQSPFVLNRTLTPEERAAAGHADTSAELAKATDNASIWDLRPRAGLRPSYPDRHGRHEAAAVNLPISGVTGLGWDTTVLEFYTAPEQYAALHFHSDQVADVGWNPLMSAQVPEVLPSDVYGIRLRTGSSVDIIPITVIAASTSARKIAFLVPTFSYLAYANELMFEEDLALGESAQVGQLDHRDEFRRSRGQFGASMYDSYRDGAGIKTSSAGRAILNMRPDYRFWLTDSGRAFSGDMYLLEWLKRNGFDFDVVTDHDLHQLGAAAIDDYAVVVTGAHPEYYSAQMLDGLTTFRARGGNIMYLGGNGFYWVTGVLSDTPLVVEIRRGMAGVRIWESAPGEVVLAATGEPGGLWRHRGRTPQSLVGVGFCAQGFDVSSPYVRSEASFDPAVSWVFDGVERTTFGLAGAVMNGAAGDELDRADPALGTPHNAVVLASSVNHSNEYQRSPEEIHLLSPAGHGGAQDANVRADMVLIPSSADGGAVFSVGSIAWSGSLVTETEDPSASQITANVLRAFGGQ
ncbi:N,N-dimethylformamidase beta subunit family domain-containing protein [Mycolicibacterium sp.]|uniref:N,N-dimethylformamidase beta subunit family domain-containing protein n=2 Tax=Mycolicibacterium sp. TaxID=2320850 RepID=UPI003D118EA5